MKKISLEDLVAGRNLADYLAVYAYVRALVEAGQIKPLKNAGKNGKTPSLYKSYWLLETRPPQEELFLEELNYRLHYAIDNGYYLKHLDAYGQERPYVKALSKYLQGDELQVPMSCNERSFAIWQEEKFLLKGGRQVLSHCGLNLEALNVYSTVEPLAYFTLHRETPQSILFIENKDTFYTLRKAMLAGTEAFWGTGFGTIIYGGGKRVISSCKEFPLSGEPYMDQQNHLYYFGDLDYEGIKIYEELAAVLKAYGELKPLVLAYTAMVKKAEALALPHMKAGQDYCEGKVFYKYFNETMAEKIQGILAGNYYIPQEIINIKDIEGNG